MFVSVCFVVANQRGQFFPTQFDGAGKLQGGHFAGNAMRDCQGKTGDHRSYQIRVQSEVKMLAIARGFPMLEREQKRLRLDSEIVEI